MNCAKSISEIRILLLVMVIITLMAGTSEGESWPVLENSDRHYRAEPENTHLAEDADDEDALWMAANGAGEGDRQELQELLAVLDAETAIATKTKMNNDYVPGMVTVLHGEQLETLGVHTVADALSLVPGIQVARLATGEPTLKVRGIAFPFNAGNIKVMLNSIALSRESSGINSSVLLTPVAQVDRIEVIRGPGSSIYGDFAMAGVVNIITKDAGGRLFGRAGDDESWGGGGHYSYRDGKHDFGLGVNLSMVDDGENAASLQRDPDEKRYTGIFKLDYKNFSLTAEGVRRNIDHQRQPELGAPPLPPGPLSEASRKEESWVMEGRQSVELGRNAGVEAYLSYLRNRFTANEPHSEFKGDRLETGIDLSWSPWSAHQLLFAVAYSESDIDGALHEGPSRTSRLDVADIGRRNYSLGLQDQVAVSERFSLTLGLRFDDYDDVGSLMTPRMAAVYRLGEHHVIKAQYSEGFRAPTFWELYQTGNANERLDFEVMGTTELAYVYRRPKSVGRVTFYYSEIDDGLYGIAGGEYENIVDIDAKGVEVEWEQQIGDKFRWLANISYNDTWDGRSTRVDKKSLGVAEWLGNLSFLLQPLPDWMVTGRLLHVGDRYAAKGWIDGYDRVDFTVSRTDLLADGITLRVGVKNIFNDGIVYLTERPNGLFKEEYRGRTWWLHVSYDF